MKTDTSEGLSFLEMHVKFTNGNCPAWLPAYDKSKPIPGLKCKSNDALLTTRMIQVKVCPFLKGMFSLQIGTVLLGSLLMTRAHLYLG